MRFGVHGVANRSEPPVFRLDCRLRFVRTLPCRHGYTPYVLASQLLQRLQCASWYVSHPRAAAAPQEGKTALHWASQFGEAGLLHELLGPGAAGDVNSADEAGNTPLHLAALNNHLCASLRRPPTHCNACT